MQGEKNLFTLKIIKGRQTKFISLGIRVHPDLWNPDILDLDNLANVIYMIEVVDQVTGGKTVMKFMKDR